MEVLIHPRVLPLSDFLPLRLSSPEPQAAFKFQEDLYFNSNDSRKLLKVGPQSMEQMASEALISDDVVDNNEMTYSTSNDIEKEPFANGIANIEMPKRTEQATAAAISEVGVVAEDDVEFANASMNSSPMSSKSDKIEDFGRDSSSNLLLEDDFPDIIDADPDTDYEE